MQRSIFISLIFIALVFTAWIWAQNDTTRSTVPELPPVQKKPVSQGKQIRAISPDLPSVEKREVTLPGYTPLSQPEMPLPERKRISVPEEVFLTPADLPEVGFLEVQVFNDFRGGLNLRDYKTNVAPNEAIELKNALWTKGGELVKREGYSEHSNPPEALNLVYRYYQQDGDKYTMGGSDTALYFWHEDSSDWTYLIGTEGTSGRWDGTAFEDMFVGTHEGVKPVIWDGEDFIEMGTSVDSFDINAIASSCWWTLPICCPESILVRFAENYGWQDNKWKNYLLGIWGDNDGPLKDGCVIDTIYHKAIILSSGANWVKVRPPQTLFAQDIDASTYAKIYSWFGVDSVWREGQLDSSIELCKEDIYDNPIARLYDHDFDWDSLFNYQEWIFEVTAGMGTGKKNFLLNVPCNQCEGDSAADTMSFYVAGFCYSEFDSTTQYRIYRPSFLGVGGKFCEVYDSRLFIGWTGSGTEQNKNRLIYSEISDIGNWPVENKIWIESDDGDYLTGMITFEPEGVYRQTPWAELVASKNQSLYRVFPVDIGGVLGYRTLQISEGVGVCSNAGMANVEGRFMVFPDQHGVYAYDGKVQTISAKIDPIFETWNFDELEKVSAIYNPQDRHYYISYPDSFTVDDTSVYCVVTWEDDRDGYWGIYAQKYNFQMTALDTNFRVDDDETATDQEAPDVDIDGQQRWIFVWGDQRYGDPYYDVRVRRFNTDGTAIDTSIQVNDDATYNEWIPDVAANVEGKFVVVWEDRRNAEYTPDIYGQRYDSSGSAVGGNFLVDTCTAACYEPQVEMTNDGKFVISWFIDPGIGGEEIFFQRYDSAGNAIGNNVGVLDTIPYDVGSFLGMSMNDNNGDFVISWSRNEQQFGTYDVWTQRYDSSGTVLGSNFKVNDDGGNYTQEHPGVAMNEGGQFIISIDDWREYAIHGFANTWLQRYSNGGGKIGANFNISDFDTSECKYNSSDIDNYGDFVVAWTAYGDTTNTYLKKFNWGGQASCAVLQVNDRRASGQITERNDVGINKYLNRLSTVNNKTLGWSIDYHGWSRESFNASAYCYQHSITDDVKILFADPENLYVYNYATQTNDVDDGVILTYQSPYFSFVPNPSFEAELSYVTIESYLSGGKTYIDLYKDYSEFAHRDSVDCSSDCREEMAIADMVTGKNISMKITTGSEVDDFVLSRFFWEYRINKCRK